MKNKKKIWAIIPARSGSKGIKNKNIKYFIKIPLIAHSINFAKKLKFIDKVFVSTDSEKYKKISMTYGAEVPFLRSKKDSKSSSMEEHVLENIRIKLLKEKIDPPDYVLWLRPTCPLRDVKLFKDAYSKFIKLNKSVCIVSRTDPRIFIMKQNRLVPLILNFKNRSMVRRQDCLPAYKMFYGEYFKFPKKFNQKFLGDSFHHIVQNDLCEFDIDTEKQFELYEKLIISEKKKYQKILDTR
jgi:CMP-N-acetylneuraminic acid synthetase